MHATPSVADGIAYFGGCDEMFRGVRIADGEEIFSLSSGAYTAASPALSGGYAYYGTFNNEVLGLDLRGRQVTWRYEHPQRHFPFYSSPLVGRWNDGHRRTRQNSARAGGHNRQSAVDLHDSRGESIPHLRPPMGESTLARTMDGCTFSISKVATNCGSLMSARRCRPRPPSQGAAS